MPAVYSIKTMVIVIVLAVKYQHLQLYTLYFYFYHHSCIYPITSVTSVSCDIVFGRELNPQGQRGITLHQGVCVRARSCVCVYACMHARMCVCMHVIGGRVVKKINRSVYRQRSEEKTHFRE